MGVGDHLVGDVGQLKEPPLCAPPTPPLPPVAMSPLLPPFLLDLLDTDQLTIEADVNKYHETVPSSHNLFNIHGFG